jgi:hypothetical protein
VCRNRDIGDAEVPGTRPLIGLVECPLLGYLSTGGTTAARPGMVEVTGRVAHFSAAHPQVWVWLRFGMRPAGRRGAERLQRGMPSSK